MEHKFEFWLNFGRLPKNYSILRAYNILYFHMPIYTIICWYILINTIIYFYMKVYNNIDRIIGYILDKTLSLYDILV